MNAKKILIISPCPLFPTVMGNQVRIKFLIEVLNKRHCVDLITLEDRRNYSVHNAHYKKICRKHYPIIIPNNKDNVIGRVFYSLGRRLVYLLFGIPSQYYYPSLPQIQREIHDIISRNDYDVIQFEYWFMGKFIKKLKQKLYLTVDTHDICHEKTGKEFQTIYGNSRKQRFIRRELSKIKELEHYYLNQCDTIISISSSDSIYFENNFPGRKILYIPIGMDLKDFLSYPTIKNNKPTVLFYGNLGTLQNIHAFFELWNEIFPRIKKEIPEAQLKVVGANPPDTIKKLASLGYVEVTGFTNCLPDILSSCHLKILPMKIGGGFRTRLIEVMASGVPVIGTYIGVDSLAFENDVHGYISDDYNVLTHKAVELLRNDEKRQHMGIECKKFVESYYTTEKVYGKLSQYYFDLELS
ncbi:MAG: glycosyltransferase family 4 protein [Candidatus Jettenia sp.]|nr:glycosyltransferase family 4 protein [Candidatus Jettenia sp.]